MLKLRLTHKAFILILVPLCFELVFIATLAILLNQAEMDALMEARSKAVVAEANTISSLYYVTGSDLVAASFTHDQEAVALVDDRLQRIAEHIQVLRELPAANERQKEQIAEVEQSALRGLELLKLARGAIEKPELGLTLVHANRGNELRNKLKGAYDELITSLNVLAAEEYDKTPSKPHYDSRVSVRQWLVAGVIFNIILAVGLALGFVASTNSRLRTVMQNTSRVATQQQLAPLVGGSDEIAELDAVFHDMANALERANKKERELNELKQRFIAMVGHDIRAPLTCIKGALEMLQSGVYGELSDRADRQINIASASANRLMALVRDLLDLDKYSLGKLEVQTQSQSLQTLCVSAATEMEILAAGKEIEIQVEADDCDVLADSDRVTQVLVNLLSNAVKFSEDQSTITVRARKQDQDHTALVEVIDHGRGIPPEKIDKLFKRYSQMTLEDSTVLRGYGLGLSISKEIVEAHGGTIGCTSELEKGTRFWFTLPLAGDPLPQDQSTTVVSPAASSSTT